jgi:hypothetical protein
MYIQVVWAASALTLEVYFILVYNIKCLNGDGFKSSCVHGELETLCHEE